MNEERDVRERREKRETVLTKGRWGFVDHGGRKGRRVAVKQGYRVILVDKDGVLVCESQLTEHDLAAPEAFVAALKQAIEDVEEEEP